MMKNLPEQKRAAGSWRAQQSSLFSVAEQRSSSRSVGVLVSSSSEGEVGGVLGRGGRRWARARVESKMVRERRVGRRIVVVGKLKKERPKLEHE